MYRSLPRGVGDEAHCWLFVLISSGQVVIDNEGGYGRRVILPPLSVSVDHGADLGALQSRSRSTRRSRLGVVMYAEVLP